MHIIKNNRIQERGIIHEKDKNRTLLKEKCKVEDLIQIASKKWVDLRNRLIWRTVLIYTTIHVLNGLSWSPIVDYG